MHAPAVPRTAPPIGVCERVQVVASADVNAGSCISVSTGPLCMYVVHSKGISSHTVGCHTTDTQVRHACVDRWDASNPVCSKMLDEYG